MGASKGKSCLPCPRTPPLSPSSSQARPLSASWERHAPPVLPGHQPACRCHLLLLNGRGFGPRTNISVVGKVSPSTPTPEEEGKGHGRHQGEVGVLSGQQCLRSSSLSFPPAGAGASRENACHCLSPRNGKVCFMSNHTGTQPPFSSYTATKQCFFKCLVGRGREHMPATRNGGHCLMSPACFVFASGSVSTVTVMS